MINFLTGNVSEIEGNNVVVDLAGAGIGLSVTVSASALSKLFVGKPCHLLTEFLVREDGWQLYGFESIDERIWFRHLHSISGIGPKTAMATLSVLGVNGVISAISAEDENALIAVPGLGKKSAGRIVLELKDKVRFASAKPNKGNDVVAALINLGWSEAVARSALIEIDVTGLDTAEILREALSKLAKQ
jgi:Holliday junction DNA helicase RuvA